jgi:ATP-binding cassette, subfamily B, bacterial PglK
MLPLLVMLFIGSSILDLAGLGLIAPYVALVVDKNAFSGPLGTLVDFLGLPREQKTILTYVGTTLFFVFLTKSISAIWINRTVIQFGENQMVRLRSYLMQSYQSLPYKEYLRRNSSEYIHCIQQLTSQYAGQVVLPLLRTTSDGIVALAILSLLALQDLRVLILLLALLGMMILGYDRLFRKNLRGYGEKVNQASAITIQGINEGIEGLKEIRILGKENYFYKKVNNGAKTQAYFGTKAMVIQSAPRYLLELIMISFIVILVMAALLLEMRLHTLVPTLSMFGVAALRLLPAANVLSNSLMQIRYSHNAVTQLYNDLEAIKQSARKVDQQTINKKENDFQTLSLEEVSYTYPLAKSKALIDVSLEINSGETIGLIGPSGSGKTTLVDMLLGMLEPQKGVIKYNDENIITTINKWRSQVAYLPQQVFLIDNELRNNVALGVDEETIDERRILEALRQANLSGLVQELPNGVNTQLGERGIRLSGGQRQRVALARAFYHNRNVLVMDEATSALDNDTEQEIVKEIQQLKGKKTMIVIAHRVTTLEHCDRIYELKKGKVVNVKSYRELIGNNS